MFITQFVKNKYRSQTVHKHIMDMTRESIPQTTHKHYHKLVYENCSQKFINISVILKNITKPIIIIYIYIIYNYVNY